MQKGSQREPEKRGGGRRSRPEKKKGVIARKGKIRDEAGDSADGRGGNKGQIEPKGRGKDQVLGRE
jgi:hypothetical protein